MQIQPETLALGMIWYIIFLFSTACHEGAHALVAKLGGDPTAFHSGQVTLNPLPHIQREPFGTVVVPLLSFFLSGWMIGWASAPYDPLWQRRHPHRAAWMAFAGPAANLALMILAAAAIRTGIRFGFFRLPETVTFARITEATNPEAMGFAATFLSVLFLLNLVLGAFNLLPVPPLDGHTAITLLMDESRAVKFLDWSQNPSFSAVGILLGWAVFGRISSHLLTLALNLLYPGVHYR